MTDGSGMGTGQAPAPDVLSAARSATPPPGPPPPPPPPAAPGQVATASPNAGPTAPPDGGIPGWVPGRAPRAPGKRGTSGRTAALVLLVIVGVVFGSNLVNAAIPYPEDVVPVDPGAELPGGPGVETAPPADPGPVAPGTDLDVGAGYSISPPEGWTLVESEDGWTVLQKSGVLVVAGGMPWVGSAADLATAYRDAWFENGQFTGDEPQEGTVGEGIPAAAITYTGVAEGAPLDGVIVAASAKERGLLLNVYGASGSLDAVSDDIDAILASVRDWAG